MAGLVNTCASLGIKAIACYADEPAADQIVLDYLSGLLPVFGETKP
jgi:hypothetical protein